MLQNRIVSNGVFPAIMLIVVIVLRFDMVEQFCLFFALRALGIDDSFLAWAGLLCNSSQCMVKLGTGLGWPIPV